MARALTRLQAGFGGARVVKGKGSAAAAVRALLLRMRQEAGVEGPIVGAALLDFNNNPNTHCKP